MREAGDVLLLTGDMHWGRIVRLQPRDAVSTGMQMVELISSPTSLVTTPVVDPLAKARADKRNPWPRHSDATLVGGVLELEGARSPFFASTPFRHRGNHVCLLSFRRRGESLEVTPRYFLLRTGSLPTAANPFVLRHR